MALDAKKCSLPWPPNSLTTILHHPLFCAKVKTFDVNLPLDVGSGTFDSETVRIRSVIYEPPCSKLETRNYWFDAAPLPANFARR